MRSSSLLQKEAWEQQIEGKTHIKPSAFDVSPLKNSDLFPLIWSRLHSSTENTEYSNVFFCFGVEFVFGSVEVWIEWQNNNQKQSFLFRKFLFSNFFLFPSQILDLDIAVTSLCDVCCWFTASFLLPDIITDTYCLNFFTRVLNWLIVGTWAASFFRFVGLSLVLTLLSGCTNKLSAVRRWGQKAGLWARRGGVRWIKERCGKGGISPRSSWDHHQEEKCQIYRIQRSPGKQGGFDALSLSRHFHTRLMGKME